MKPSLFISTVCVAASIFSAACYAQDPNKMTYEKAMASHKATYGKYSEQSVTAEESQLAWDSHQQKPAEDPISGELEELWSGSAKTVSNRWGKGNYYIDFDFGYQNQGGSVWLTIDNSGVTKKVGVPSPFNYEGNYYVTFDGVQFVASKSRTSGRPVITHISRVKTKK